MLWLVLLQPLFDVHALICVLRLRVCHRKHLNHTNQILRVTAEMFGFLYCSCLVATNCLRHSGCVLCAAWMDACYIFNVAKSGAVAPVRVCL